MPPPDPDRWARLRFAIVGPLLAAPPPPGELRQRLTRLAAQAWRHPTTGQAVYFSAASIERWYYLARGADDPVTALRRRARADAGHPRCVSPALSEALHQQYQRWPAWSVQLHVRRLAFKASC